ncbi:ABC transporter ATP-binding protein [Microbaculum marinum]|uniref:ABC transporter ATP-binding protein n=1 Tax=Microbaculum marinum TaxID=1764581 RepID=A0AAW9RQH4_9HYPH
MTVRGEGTGPAPVLEVEGLTRDFDALRAVDDVSFAVMPSELLGLIGPNGAGKTTLFNMLAGALPPTAGRIRLQGRDITGLAPNRIATLGIARTYQNLRVFPDMTVFDNVSVGAIGRFGVSLWGTLVPGLERRRSDRIADATIAALERLGLIDHADAPAGNLSYGQKKLLEVARALTLAPTLLLLDEPAAGLNPNETEALSLLVRTLADEGLTILLVEHDMPMVMRVCDRIVVLDSGRKIADGAPRAVRSDPAVRAAYLGDPE